MKDFSFNLDVDSRAPKVLKSYVRGVCFGLACLYGMFGGLLPSYL